jgi:hypothetical protein
MCVGIGTVYYVRLGRKSVVAGPISHGSPRHRQPPDPRPRFTQGVCGVIAPIPGSSPCVEFFHSLLGLALLYEAHDGTHDQLVPASCLQIALTYTRFICAAWAA